ncbi:thiamine-phosphate diphosphorylase [Allosphingosinicella indica]|uniref:Thiamine-phosphate diphosphorylase n=2 Tax=Allosphingosinicella indica TaxID=941907 RepID=A0A1X7G5N7_9SPHN|nr:thiamine-phosphate diphosphorylase [Allosphingosinicella indica]
MTDERLGGALLEIVASLPPGSGIVFRHYSLAPVERRTLFDRVRAAAGDAVLLLAGPDALAAEWGADGSHNRDSQRRGEGWRSAPVHALEDLRAAEAAGADFVFLSPLFATRSHPGAAPLGPERFAEIAREAEQPVIALGGMNEDRGREAEALGAYGWAGIDAFAARPMR